MLSSRRESSYFLTAAHAGLFYAIPVWVPCRGLSLICVQRYLSVAQLLLGGVLGWEFARAADGVRLLGAAILFYIFNRMVSSLGLITRASYDRFWLHV